MATGTTSVDFGAAPGSDLATVDVTGLSGLTAASYLEAFAMYEASADMDADESLVDPVNFSCEYLTATSMRIHAQVGEGERIGVVPVRYVTA